MHRHLWILALLSACDAGKPSDTGDTAAPGDSAPEETGADTDTGDTGETGETGDTGETGETGVADADGDGFAAPEDCDDGDARVFPGAPERCDPVDQDCDGAPLAEGVCGEEQDAGDVSEILTSPDAAQLFHDLTGDGRADFLTVSLDVPRPDGRTGFGCALYAGGTTPEAPIDAPAGALATWTAGLYDSDFDNFPIDGGDLDGDGTADLVFVAHYVNNMYVHLGPFPTDGSARWMDDSDEVWTSPVPELYGMQEVASGGDLDGDGRADLVGSEGGSSDSYITPSCFDAFFGGTWGETTVRVFSEYRSSGSYFDILEDVDGDGTSDLHAICRTDVGSYHYLVPGADLRGADGADVEDLQIARMPVDDGSAVGTVLDDDGWRSAGDWNGDGIPEMIVNARLSETLGYAHGEVFLLGGVTRGEFTLDDAALGSWVGNEEGGSTGIDEVVEADGEPGKELILGDRRSAYLVRHQVPALRTPMDGLRLGGTTISRGTPRDFDGDGREDWLFGDLDAGTSNVWLGWDVPWDEEIWW